MFTGKMDIYYFLADIEAECQDDYMKITVGFNGTFKGLVYSAGKPFSGIFPETTHLEW